MKRTLLGCLILILAAIALVVSCNAETAVPVDDVAYIRFDGETRDLSVKYDTKDYADLYWFYTAVKADGYGTSGEKEAETLVNTVSNYKGFSKAVGPFSQGEWTFTLNAYSSLAENSTTSPKEDTKVYESGEFTVVLTGGETKSVKVSVTPYGEKGKLALSGAYFSYENGKSTQTRVAPSLTLVATRTTKNTSGKYPVYILSTDSSYTKSGDDYAVTTTTIQLGDPTDSAKTKDKDYLVTFANNVTNIEMETGTYQCVATAYIPNGNETTKIAEQTFYFGIYSGEATTNITGSIIEGLKTYVNFDVAKQEIITEPLKTEAASESDTTLVSSEINYSAAVSPKAYTETSSIKATSVVIEKGALPVNTETTDTIDYSLSVTVTEASGGDNSFSFGTSSNENLYGSIDLKLTKIVNGVEQSDAVSFETGKYVTVTTYIGLIYSDENNQTLISKDDIKIVYTGSAGKDAENITVEEYSNGFVTFKTSHFSNFAIINKKAMPAVKVVSGNSVSYYATLEEAIADAPDGSTLTLQLDTTLSASVSTNKTFTINLNGKKLTADENAKVELLDGASVTVSGETTIINGVKDASGNYTPALFSVTKDSTTTSYSTLKAAVDAAEADSTITILQDMTLRENVTVDKALKINLDGKLLSPYDKKVTVGTNGVLTVKGSKDGQENFVVGVETGSTSGVDGTYYPTFASALKKSSDKAVITLWKDDDSITSQQTLDRNLTVDLNKKTLSFAVTTDNDDNHINLGAFELPDSESAYTVTFKNGSIKGTRSGKKTNVFTVHSNGTLALDGVEMDVTSTRGIQVYPNTDPAALRINGSTIKVTGDYAVATEATVKEGTTSKNIDIKITGSTLETTNNEYDNTALLVNVPSTVIINDSTFIGERQAAIFRGGESTITDSVFRCKSTKTAYTDWADSGDNDWGIGNRVPLAAVVVGNRNAGSYKYATSVTFYGTNTLEVAGTEGRKIQLYVYQTDSYPVTVKNAKRGWTLNENMNNAKVEYSEATWYNKNNNEFTLSDKAQLMEFADLVNNGVTFEGKTVRLGDDIDLESVEWTPIGNGSRSSRAYTGNAFKGTFDGNSKTISNLKITNKTLNECVGLFGVLDGGTVKNLTLTGVAVDAAGCENVGSVVGLALNNSTVENVTVESGSVKAKETGGLVGRMLVSGTIKDCTNKADITSTDGGTGGIVGKAYYSELGKEINIINCTNSGTINSKTYVGGIAGLLAGNATGCTNTGAVTATAGSVGGIVGEMDNYGVVSGCTNSGEISTTAGSNCNGIGGIVGWIKYQTNTNSYGKTTPIEIIGNTNESTGKINGNMVNGAGGIVGLIYNTAEVENNTNNAESISGGTFVCGIVGGHQKNTGNALNDKDSIEATTIVGNVSTTASDKLILTGTTGCKTDVVWANTSGEEEINIGGNTPGTNDNRECYIANSDGTKTYYKKLQDAIDNAPDGSTVSLLSDVDFDMSNATASAVLIEKSLTLDGNSHSLKCNTKMGEKPLLQVSNEGTGSGQYTVIIRNLDICNTYCQTGNQHTKSFGDYPRLVNIWDLKSGNVTFENVKISSIDYGYELRGISISDNSDTVVNLDNCTVDIPTYYTIMISSSSRGSKVTLNMKNNSMLKGWATIYNFDNNTVINAEDSTFDSVNDYSGDSNSFSSVIVSELKRQNEEITSSAVMTFKNCTFIAKLRGDDADVKQDIFDIRNTAVSSLSFEGCEFSPARNSDVIIYNNGSSTNHTISVTDKSGQAVDKTNLVRAYTYNAEGNKDFGTSGV